MDMEFSDFTTQDRLVATVLDLWATQGHAAISARLLARMTGIPTSSIYHHFGSMEHLFHSAQGHALQSAQQWCADRLSDLVDWPQDGGPEALAPALATVIDDWATGARTLAFAWAQCHLLALRDPAYVAALNGWRDLWAGFWREVCTRAGLEDYSRATAHVFDGTVTLHLIRWRRTLDRAALDDLCRGWSRWLGGHLAGGDPWRSLARDIALAAEPPHQSRNSVVETIAQAAAAVVEDGGVAALTHRAVAARAGVTLGVVSYNVRTASQLAELAFETIYRNITAPVRGSNRPAPGVDDALISLRDFMSQPRTLIAMEELTLAVARDPALASFGPQLRYLRGKTSGLHLAAHLGPDAKLSPLDTAIYSSLVSGQRRALIGRDPVEIRASFAETDRLITSLHMKS